MRSELLSETLTNSAQLRVDLARRRAQDQTADSVPGKLNVTVTAEHVDLAVLRQQLGHGVELATEAELSKLFPDCAVGAVPPVGPAWNMDTYLDDCFLGDDDEIFFEAGDHEDLVRVSGDQFQKLLGDVRHGHYGYTV